MSLHIPSLSITIAFASVLTAAPLGLAEAQGDSSGTPTAATRPAMVGVAGVATPATDVTRSTAREFTGETSTQPATGTGEVRGRIDHPGVAIGAYYGFLGGAVAANAIGHFVDDPGGYPKQWDQWTVFHLVGGWSLDALGEKLSVPVAYKGVPVRPMAVCATVVAWEEVKGHADWRDMLAGCAGAAVSAGSTWLFRAVF
jgi:hypothetical protein